MFRQIVPFLLLAAPVAAQEVETVDFAAQSMRAHPEFEGVENALALGSPGADAGAFVANSMMFEGALFPPHTHPNERLSLVLEGVMYLGVGDTVDPSNEIAVPAGSAARVPAGVMHYMISRDGDVRIAEIGTAPSPSAFAE